MLNNIRRDPRASAYRYGGRGPVNLKSALLPMLALYFETPVKVNRPHGLFKMPQVTPLLSTTGGLKAAFYITPQIGLSSDSPHPEIFHPGASWRGGLYYKGCFAYLSFTTRTGLPFFPSSLKKYTPGPRSEAIRSPL